MNREELQKVFDQLAHCTYNADEQLLNEINFKVCRLKDNIETIYKTKYLRKLKEISNELDESLTVYLQEYIKDGDFDDTYLECGNNILKQLHDYIKGL